MYVHTVSIPNLLLFFYLLLTRIYLSPVCLLCLPLFRRSCLSFPVLYYGVHVLKCHQATLLALPWRKEGTIRLFCLISTVANQSFESVCQLNCFFLLVSELVCTRVEFNGDASATGVRVLSIKSLNSAFGISVDQYHPSHFRFASPPVTTLPNHFFTIIASALRSHARLQITGERELSRRV